MLTVLLACDDPRTSWFFQLVAGLVFSSLGTMQKVERTEEALVARVFPTPFYKRVVPGQPEI
jgi:hypothetical protein